MRAGVESHRRLRPLNLLHRGRHQSKSGFECIPYHGSVSPSPGHTPGHHGIVHLCTVRRRTVHRHGPGPTFGPEGRPQDGLDEHLGDMSAINIHGLQNPRPRRANGYDDRRCNAQLGPLERPRLPDHGVWCTWEIDDSRPLALQRRNMHMQVYRRFDNTACQDLGHGGPEASRS
nr:hypothetical protein CFP56_32237 [Quercus suber]